MMYNDPVALAREKSSQAAAFLLRHNLAPHPVNYTVSYEYSSGQNAGLCQAIEQRVAARLPFDDFIMAELYSHWIEKSHQQNEQLVQRVSTMVTRLSGCTDLAHEATNDYLELLDHQLPELSSSDPALKLNMMQLIEATEKVRRCHLQLNQQLELANQQSHQLRTELKEVKQLRLLDPLTGLYNRLAMQEHLELWLTEQPERQIAAIAVDLDHFRQFNQDYGDTIGDVILSKVARKVRSYVQDSGLPVRAGGEEFLILLPDVDLRTAGEIAEQVRKGVEKLRFVSSRSKKTLPKVTISLGVSLYQAKENWQQFLARTSQILQIAKHRGRNQVATETML
ncbi:GGDEF domain-containing protein [Alkalimonas sp. MEB108]|uniref:diguanylate cyclase n=1 Tax=Alkalimonas cellulosilytica TaxID=3058395 RepID=A0ABU7J6S2_9GAMM|nr:GGDEF domain-containing protein [Alkalimonas sp. MEB108]MEE2002201.1 GGDEF domain-containing protein [Alkalimonas sp. MEB108]